MTLKDEYLSKAFGSPAMAAAYLAKDLSRGDPKTFKAGYTIENAVLAAREIFPRVSEVAIRRLNDW